MEKRIIKGNVKSLNIKELSKEVVIIGNVIDTTIFSTNNIEIYGNVEKSKIVSNSGRIEVVGKVSNSEIKAFSFVKINSVENSLIESSFSSCMKAFSIIENTKGNTLNSNLNSGMEISLYNIGKSGINSESELKISKKNSNNIFEVVFVHKQKISDLDLKLKELERYIKVLDIIKDKINTLPEEKKREITLKIREYKKNKEYLNFIKEETRRLLITDPEEIKYNRTIIIKNDLFPPVKISIDGKEEKILEQLKEVAFYNSGIIIKGEIKKVYNKRNFTKI